MLHATLRRCSRWSHLLQTRPGSAPPARPTAPPCQTRSRLGGAARLWRPGQSSSVAGSLKTRNATVCRDRRAANPSSDPYCSCTCPGRHAFWFPAEKALCHPARAVTVIARDCPCWSTVGMSSSPRDWVCACACACDAPALESSTPWPSAPPSPHFSCSETLLFLQGVEFCEGVLLAALHLSPRRPHRSLVLINRVQDLPKAAVQKSRRTYVYNYQGGLVTPRGECCLGLKLAPYASSLKRRGVAEGPPGGLCAGP